ncbi:uncharacterized protein FTOL_08982 [Fusarium torulosum]|uniref:N-acetyltransferase domain-containing protein n=1 Tax=Fusarium torulosum TaxID=33205 RepID=A0AAE8SKZ3_9HYPO|nr:uncharacterized protein FTOL_08982 [Fusarium torulosum]
MAHYLDVKPVSEVDMPSCMEILIPSFEFMSISEILNGLNTSSDREALSNLHWQTIQEHVARYPQSGAVGIKCVDVDQVTRNETIIGYAEWFIYPQPRALDECLKPLGFMQPPRSADNDKNVSIRDYFRPSIETRADIMGTQPYGLLVWLCVSPSFRRKGAASRLMKWGTDQCAKLAVPAYLEASHEGKKLYESLGWQELQHPRVRDIGYPIMMWWPNESPETRDVGTDMHALNKN